MSSIPPVVPPLPREKKFSRHLPVSAAFGWLQAGWRDFLVKPGLSLFYGVGVFAVSLLIVWGLFALEIDYILFPALAGFMVIGPIIAVGLYEKSRRLSAGEELRLHHMIFVRPRSAVQIFFTGALLCVLMVFWLRAAVLIYALFFGLQPFPGLADITTQLLGTRTGWWMLGVGSAVGALFAGFSFAISALSLPMMLNERIDAFTAMGKSTALVWNNLPVMLTWGAIILFLFVLSLALGMLGLIVVFPLLGHGTWHAYLAMRG